MLPRTQRDLALLSTSEVYRTLLAKPVLRAYILAFLSTTSPSLLSLLPSLLRGKVSLQKALLKAVAILKRQAGVGCFPLSAALIVAASAVPAAAVELWNRSCSTTRLLKNSDAVVLRFLLTYVAGIFAFDLLNRPRPHQVDILHKAGNTDAQTTLPEGEAHISSQTNVTAKQAPLTAHGGHAGRTLDLTLFALVRGLDILISSAWHSSSAFRGPSLSWEKLYRSHQASNIASPLIFALSSYLIMWSWFYTPERLPRSYNNWISSAAQLDQRLIQALRECRKGNFVYGKDTGVGDILGTLAEDHKLPYRWGDPAQTVPVACELVHCTAYSKRNGSASADPYLNSCEHHAMLRFRLSWLFAMRMYLPLNIVATILSNRDSRSRRNSSTSVALAQSLFSASQSSAFLASFVTLFYYGVCLARSRIGPTLHDLLASRKYGSAALEHSAKIRRSMFWDSGNCVRLGCLLCGWSILLEQKSRRTEIAFFVAPRALATILPRRYNVKSKWREQLAFATSVSVIMTAAATDPSMVRGVFGRLLKTVLE